MKDSWCITTQTVAWLSSRQWLKYNLGCNLTRESTHWLLTIFIRKSSQCCHVAKVASSVDTELFPFLSHIIAWHKTGSYRFEIEEGWWFHIDRSEHIVGYIGNIKDEEYVFVTCPRYEVIRLANKIDVWNIFSLWQLVPFDLGCCIRDLIPHRSWGWFLRSFPWSVDV